jgi:hypothetical protein
VWPSEKPDGSWKRRHDAHHTIKHTTQIIPEPNHISLLKSKGPHRLSLLRFSTTPRALCLSVVPSFSHLLFFFRWRHRTTPFLFFSSAKPIFFFSPTTSKMPPLSSYFPSSLLRLSLTLTSTYSLENSLNPSTKLTACSRLPSRRLTPSCFCPFGTTVAAPSDGSDAPSIIYTVVGQSQPQLALLLSRVESGNPLPFCFFPAVWAVYRAELVLCRSCAILPVCCLFAWEIITDCFPDVWLVLVDTCWSELLYQ